MDIQEKLELAVAHLTKTVDEMSDIMARQQKEIDVLQRRAEMLMQREAGREADGGGAVVLGDERPPHY